MMESTQQCKGGAECVVEPDTQARPTGDDIEKETDNIRMSNENVNKYKPTNKRQQYQQYRQRKQPAAVEASDSNMLLTEENLLLYGITCTVLLFMILNYAKNKYKRRQREMEESSNQLALVRQRNLLANRDMKVAVDELHDSPRDARTLPQSPTSKHMSNIRENQQNRFNTSTKLSRKKKTKKKQTLKKYLDMNHKAADEALERRQRVIAAEQKLVQPRRRFVQQQQQRNDFEEAERVALVQQQNADYEEALQLDQARSQQLSLKKEIRLKRKRYRQDAEQRLTIAGVQSHDIILTNNQNNNIATGESSVRVRLLLPSGRKVDGVFAATQELGLVYDLALLVLDKENLLSNDEDGEGDTVNDDTTDTDDDQDEGLLPSSGEKDYTVIQQSWQDVFFPFSLVSTYPQRSYKNLDTTLKNCGLNKAASLMVVVETD